MNVIKTILKGLVKTTVTMLVIGLLFGALVGPVALAIQLQNALFFFGYLPHVGFFLYLAGLPEEHSECDLYD